MIYFVALLPATALTIAGYFVLYLANRSEGALRSFGKYLGFWAFTLAGLIVLGAIFAAAHHGGRHGGMIGAQSMDGGMMHGPWRGDRRFCGPRVQEPRDTDPGGAPDERVTPQTPAGAANPGAASGAASSPH
jgi:hypothetical protein